MLMMPAACEVYPITGTERDSKEIQLMLMLLAPAGG